MQPPLIATNSSISPYGREVLNGIRVVKFQSWSSVFLKRIREIRDLELKYLTVEKLYDGAAFVFFNVTPTAMSVLVISTYSATGGKFLRFPVFDNGSFLDAPSSR